MENYKRTGEDGWLVVYSGEVNGLKNKTFIGEEYDLPIYKAVKIGNHLLRNVIVPQEIDKFLSEGSEVTLWVYHPPLIPSCFVIALALPEGHVIKPCWKFNVFWVVIIAVGVALLYVLIALPFGGVNVITMVLNTLKLLGSILLITVIAYSAYGLYRSVKSCKSIS